MSRFFSQEETARASPNSMGIMIFFIVRGILESQVNTESESARSRESPEVDTYTTGTTKRSRVGVTYYVNT